MQVGYLSLLANCPFGQALPALALTCALFDQDKFASKARQVFHCLATPPKSTQFE